MQLRTVAVILYVMAIYFIISVAAENAFDDAVGKGTSVSIFLRLVAGALVTGLAALVVKIEVP